jgi:NSS family neurotransmitter:Na+ symporter
VQQTRDHWSSRVGFVLAAAGSAVGLGNLWKFPYITWDNQGGAFVLVYLVCIALIGLPIMMTEILIGRRTQKSPVGALREAIGPAWGLVGALGVFTGFVILGYYTVIAGWSLRNFVNCLNWSFTSFPAPEQVGARFAAFLASWKLQLLTSTIFMATTMGVIFCGIGKGIERAARWLMPVLLLILVLLLGSAMAMDGAGQALSFIFAPDFSKLGWHGVLEALGHSFFTLSLGMGAMITYGSYMSRKESVVSASLLVVVLDTLIALAATMILFSVIFSVPGMRAQVGEVGAFTILFVTLPEMFYTAVPLGTLLAPLFYVLVAFAALTSTISLLEVVVSYFIDQRGVSRRGATTLCGLTTLVMTLLCSVSLGAWGLLSNFPGFVGPGGDPKTGLLSNLDHLASNWLLPIGGLLITVGVGWFTTRATTETELVDSTTPAWFRYGAWRFIIRYVAPLAVFMIICFVIFGGEDFS